VKLLSDILYKVRLEEVVGSTHMAISSVTFDSRKVKKDSLFIATVGTAVDGHAYIQKAIDLGALAIVCEHIPEDRNESITYIKVTDSTFALGIIACNYFDNPSEKLKLIEKFRIFSRLAFYSSE
jgi:UDP-N-acetylmuramoyl-L-alanyl-D-glutamate--2,6-diaminopimelate ligase